MSAPSRLRLSAPSRTGRLLGAAVAISLLCPLLPLPGGSLLPAAMADSAVSPTGGSFTIKGSGFGHGFGMSQYGAYGAARRGLSWKKILAFYYPRTVLSPMPTGTTIRVWLTADADDSLRVVPAAGLTVRDASGHSLVLPTGSRYTSWRISRSGAGYRLSYRGASGSYTTKSTTLTSSTWSFATTAKVVTVVLPSGSTRAYRGSVSLVKRGSGGRTVNKVLLEDYVRAVVPSEMPTSWAADAVRVQAVAARSYAVRLRDFSSYSGYDICDNTNCQVYSGRSHEDRQGDAAVKATAGIIVSYHGSVALTQFASSNGGASAKSSLPYLTAHPDPYDGVVTSQSWSRTITADSLSRQWPSVGTVKKLQVTARDGSGRWGGRVRTIRVIGSRGSVDVGGTTFQYRYGMRSSLYTVAGATTTGSPAPTDPPPGNPAPTDPAPVSNAPGRAWATFPRSYRSTSTTDLLMVTAGTLRRYPVASSVIGSPATLGTGFGSYRYVLNAGDWNGDGYQDVIVRTASGRVLLFRGTSSGRLAAGVDMGFGAGIRAMAGIGDADGDSRPDLAVISTAGDLWLYLGNGSTGRRSRTRISSGWGAAQSLRGPGDVTGDGRPDLVTVTGDRLLLHRATRSGFAPAVALGTGWSAYAALAAVGDVSGDGRGDLLARTASGRIRLFAGDGRGHFGSAATLAGRWTGTRFAI